MKITFLPLAAVAALALGTAGVGRLGHGIASAQPPAAQPDPRAKDAEPLPEFPKADPKSKIAPLNPDKTLVAEVLDGKVTRIGVVTEVCLREGQLEVFLCKQGTKEHESIIRVDLDARLIHAALEAAGAKAGAPTQFVNPKTNELEYKPARGAKIKVTVHYRKDNKLHTHPAQEWIWNGMKKKALDIDWVFTGSQLIKDIDNPKAEPFYGANSGEVIGVSNFPYSMLELPVEISKDNDALSYEAKTDRIPPLFSKVWLILEVVPEKK
jgi:hypothetical protein